MGGCFSSWVRASTCAGSEEGFVVVSCQGRWNFGRRNFSPADFGRRGRQSPAGGAFRRRGGWKNRLFIFHFQMRDLLLDLRLELVRSALELVHLLPHLACDLRQLLRPKDDERQKE